MNFWRRLRYYLIGVTIGLIFVFSFFKNRGCSWLPENRVLDKLSKSMILRTDSIKCVLDCAKISDEDIFRLFIEGDVIFGESQVQNDPKSYVISGVRKSDNSEFKMSFLIRDTTAQIEQVFSASNCNCSGSDNSVLRIVSMPEEMLKETFLHKDITMTQYADCKIKCRNWADSTVRKMVIDGKIDFDNSKPRAHPHPEYTIIADSVLINVELTQNKTRILNVSIENDSLCNCKEN